MHDLSGLLAANQTGLDLVIVVLDDDGGGIFSFLPIAQQLEAAQFDRLLGTPHGLDLSRVADLFELEYARARSAEELEKAIATGLQRGGVCLVHVPLDREQNEARFRELIRLIAQTVDREVST